MLLVRVNGKSEKEVTETKKKEAINAVKTKTDKKQKELMDKADAKTGVSASVAGGPLKK